MGNETQFVIPFPVYSHYHEQDEEKLRNPVVRLPEVVEGKLGGFDNWGPAAKAGETEHEVTAEVQLFDDRGCDSVQQHVQTEGNNQYGFLLGGQHADVTHFEPF